MTLFQPTYLCIKQHVQSGLLYLCKTAKKDPTKYLGSGTYWKRHLREHGKQVETLWYCLFTEKDELIKFALMCSEQWNIVDAKDQYGKKIWANLIFENGIDGTPVGRKRPDVSVRMKGLKRPTIAEHNRKNKKGNTYGSANKGRVSTYKGKHPPQVKCPHCPKLGSPWNMKRYHFDNCKVVTNGQ